MVQPSPFERLLQRAHEQAQNDPIGAFAQRDDLYGKSLTDLDVRHLSAFVAHVGGSALGRFEEALAFTERCLKHPALEKGGDTEASINRAIAVLATCANNEERAAQAIQAGVRNDVERCRVSLLSGQALVSRMRLREAAAHLIEAQQLMNAVGDNDELRNQAATIAINITRAADQRLKAAGQCAVAAANLLTACLADGDWQDQHKALYQQAQAQITSGRPAAALVIVQDMMRLENKNQASSEIRFYTASLAARAQTIRGQFKVAGAALKACRSMLKESHASPDHSQMATLLSDIEIEIKAAQAAINRQNANLADS